MFLTGAILFAGASAVGGIAPDFELLLVARVAQGVGGALMLPTSVAIVSAAFPPEQRGRALGTMGGGGDRRRAGATFVLDATGVPGAAVMAWALGRRVPEHLERFRALAAQ